MKNCASDKNHRKGYKGDNTPVAADSKRVLPVMGFQNVDLENSVAATSQSYRSNDSYFFVFLVLAIILFVVILLALECSVILSLNSTLTIAAHRSRMRSLNADDFFN